MSLLKNDLGFHFDNIKDRSKTVTRIVENAEESIRHAGPFARDIFNALYQNEPRLKSPPRNPYAKTIKELIENPNYSSLRRMANNSLSWSSLASSLVIDELTKQGAGGGGDGWGDSYEEAEDSDGDSKDDKSDGTSKRAAKQIERALDKAQEKMESLNGPLAGTESAVPSVSNYDPRLVDFAHAILKNKSTVKILNMIGRMKEVFSGVDAVVKEKPAEKIDIEYGNAVDRILPHELAIANASPELSDRFMQKFFDKELAQYKVRGTAKLGKGPVIVCIDDSSSMHGGCYSGRYGGDHDDCESYIWARSVALAAYLQACQQHRSFAAIIFDTRAHLIKPRADKRLDSEFLQELVTYSLNGGTAFDPPWKAAVRLMKSKDNKWSKADVVFITDGGAHASDWSKDKKELACRVTSFLVGMAEDHIKRHQLAKNSEIIVAFPDASSESFETAAKIVKKSTK